MESNILSEYHKSVLNREVGLYNNIKKTRGSKINLLEWLTDRCDTSLIKEIRGTDDPEKRQALKQRLPVITPSGIFGAKRDTAHLVSHTGLIQIDIDKKDNGHILNFDSLGAEISKLGNVAYCGRSVSSGWWAIIPIAFPEMHLGHFLFIEQVFKGYGIIIDTSGKDVTRTRFLSHDDDPYLNHDAVELRAYISPKQTDDVFNNPGGKRYNNNETINALLRIIERNRLDITQGYQKWFNIGVVLANTFNQDGLAYFQRMSRFHPGFDSEECSSQFEKCLHGNYGYGMGTLVKYCKDAGLIFKHGRWGYNGDVETVV